MSEEAASPARPAPSLATTVARMHAALQAARGTELAQAGLTADQWRALDHLVRRGPVTMSTLASDVALTGPTATRVADALAQSSLVYRGVDPDDRRRILLHASARGRRLHARLATKVTARHERALRETIAHLPAEDRRELADLLAARAAG